MDAARRMNRFGWDGTSGPMRFDPPRRDPAMQDAPAATAINFDDVKKGLARLLPVIEPIARLTPNKLDDAAVAFLKLVLANPAAVLRCDE